MASINISSFAGAGAQFFDNNGTPLIGGLLYVYTAGTTTPATTWTSPSGTVANTNPIVLDAGGRTPYEIWVTGGALYKFVLKNSTGVTIGTYDSIPAIDDPTAFNNIITVTGTNTLIGTSTPQNTAYTRGMTLSFVVVNTNTGAVTIDVDGLGAKEITFSGSTPLIAGQLTAGALVIIEYDGTRFQLMNSSGALAITASSINGGQIAGFRNRIINGAMVIDQRNAGASVSASGSFPVDRFQSFMSYTSNFTFQQNAGSVTPPAGFSNYVGITTGTGRSIGASDVGIFFQSIEGYNVSDLAWGTANAKTVSLSFWARSSITGTHSGSVANSGDTRSYVFSFTISAANTWEYKTVVIAGDTSGTWLTGNNKSIVVSFNTGSGTSKLTTAGAWNASGYYGATGSVQIGATTGATLYVTGVQFELGSTATPFEQRLYSTELSLCQRYFYQVTSANPGTGNAWDSVYTGCVMNAISSTDCRGALLTPVPLRAQPSVSSSNAVVFGGTGNTQATLSLTVNGTSGTAVRLSSASVTGLVTGSAYVLAFSGSAAGYLQLSAEI